MLNLQQDIPGGYLSTLVSAATNKENNDTDKNNNINNNSSISRNLTQFLSYYNEVIIGKSYAYKKLKYRLYTDYTPENERVLEKHDSEYQHHIKNYQGEASRLKLSTSPTSESDLRQIKFIKSTLTSTDPYVTENLFRLKRRMEKAFQDAHVIKIVKKTSEEIENDNNITTKEKIQKLDLKEANNVIADLHSTPEEKLYVWKGFRDSLGPKVRNDYIEYVRLKNIAARENGYADAGGFVCLCSRFQKIMSLIYRNYYIKITSYLMYWIYTKVRETKSLFPFIFNHQ